MENNKTFDFNRVEIWGDKRKGEGKWSNVDLIAVKYYKNILFHFDINPKLTSFEVKKGIPDIQAIQQAASYLKFSVSSYICFFDENFTNSETTINNLKVNKIWDRIKDYGLGVIVAYSATYKSTKPYFLILREAPEISIDIKDTEYGIDIYLSSEAKWELSNALVDQMQAVGNFARHLAKPDIKKT